MKKFILGLSLIVSTSSFATEIYDVSELSNDIRKSLQSEKLFDSAKIEKSNIKPHEAFVRLAIEMILESLRLDEMSKTNNMVNVENALESGQSIFKGMIALSTKVANKSQLFKLEIEKIDPFSKFSDLLNTHDRKKYHINKQKDLKEDQEKYCSLYSKSNNESERLTNIANLINLHFKRKYERKDGRIEKRVVNGKQYIVNRPNHGLSHGMRQSMLTVEILNYIEKTTKENALISWAKEEMKKDPRFKEKAEFIAAFQRSGREGEGTLQEYEILNDFFNCYFSACELYEKGSLFLSYEEAEKWSACLLQKLLKDYDGDKEWSEELLKIIRISHYLDLERLRYDREKSGLNKYLKEIGIEEGDNEYEKLINFTHALLIASGDFGNLINKNTRYQDAFFVLENDPKKLVTSLFAMREFIGKNQNADDDDMIKYSIRYWSNNIFN